jgi:hypothetical protein
MLGVLVWFGLAGEAAAQKTNRVAITKPPPQYTEDIDTYRARYRYESDRLAAEYDTKASKYRRADGTVDTSDPGWQKLNNKYKQEAAKLRNEYNSQHPSQTSINEVRKTPAGQSLEKTGSDVSSPFSDGDWTAGSDADAAGVVEQLRQKGHRITYDEKLGMYHDETADTKIWEPENPSRSKARASNPEGYTRAGSLEHEGIKSENAQYDPRGYVEDLYKKYEAAKAKGDTRTMNKVAAKMQEATGQRFDPRTQTMRVDGNPLEAGEATLGESPEIRGRKAQAAQQRLDQVVENARTRAEIQSESLTHQRTDLAKQEQGHGKLKSAEEYLEANRKIQRTEPKAGEPAKADAKAPKTEPKPGTKPDGKVPKTMAESAPKGETWRNVLTGKELPVGTSGNQYVDKTAKALSNSKVQAGLQAVGAVMVAKDGYDTVNAVNEAAERGDLDEANKIGSKGVGRLTGAWIGAEAGGKLGAAVGAGLGDGPGGIVGGFLGALGGGILGGMVGDAVGEEVGPGAINKVRDAAVDMATRDVEGAPPGSAEWMRSKGIAPEKVEEFSRRLAAVATSDTAEDNAKKIWQEIKDEVKQARATAVASDGTADGGAGASAGGDVDGGGGSGGAVDAGVGAGGVIAGAGGSGASVRGGGISTGGGGGAGWGVSGGVAVGGGVPSGGGGAAGIGVGGTRGGADGAAGGDESAATEATASGADEGKAGVDGKDGGGKSKTDKTTDKEHKGDSDGECTAPCDGGDSDPGSTGAAGATSGTAAGGDEGADAGETSAGEESAEADSPPELPVAPPGGEIVDKGWIKGSDGTTTHVVETVDADGNVTKVSHVTYGPDGKVVDVQNYPAGSPTDNADTEVADGQEEIPDDTAADEVEADDKEADDEEADDEEADGTTEDDEWPIEVTLHCHRAASSASGAVEVHSGEYVSVTPGVKGGRPPYLFEWELPHNIVEPDLPFDGNPERFTLESDKSYALLYKPKEGDYTWEGYFTMTARSSGNPANVASDKIKVIVDGRRIELTLHCSRNADPKSGYVIIRKGETVTVSASVKNGRPPYRIEWRLPYNEGGGDISGNFDELSTVKYKPVGFAWIKNWGFNAIQACVWSSGNTEEWRDPSIGCDTISTFLEWDESDEQSRSITPPPRPVPVPVAPPSVTLPKVTPPSTPPTIPTITGGAPPPPPPAEKEKTPTKPAEPKQIEKKPEVEKPTPPKPSEEIAEPEEPPPPEELEPPEEEEEEPAEETPECSLSITGHGTSDGRNVFIGRTRDGNRVSISVVGDSQSASAEGVGEASVSLPYVAGDYQITVQDLDQPECVERQTINIPEPEAEPEPERDCHECLSIGGSTQQSASSLSLADGTSESTMSVSQTYFVEGCPGDRVRISVKGSDGWTASAEAVDSPASVTRTFTTESGTDTITVENLSIPNCSLTFERSFGSSAADLREAEAAAGEGGAVAKTRVVQDVVGSKNARADQRTGNSLQGMAVQQEMQRAATSGDQRVREAQIAVDSAGRAAQATHEETQRRIKAEDTQAAQIMSTAIMEGIGTGLAAGGSRLGSGIGEHAAGKIFDHKSKQDKPAPSATAAGSAAPTESAPGKAKSQPKTKPAASEKGDSGKPQTKSTPQPTSAPASGEPTILVDALCPICGEMYNPNQPHQCSGAPKPPPTQALACEICGKPPATVVTTVDSGRKVMCNACQANHRCPRCGKVAMELTGAGYSMGYILPDGTKTNRWASISGVCSQCLAKWKQDQGISP